MVMDVDPARIAPTLCQRLSPGEERSGSQNSQSSEELAPRAGVAFMN